MGQHGHTLTILWHISEEKKGWGVLERGNKIQHVWLLPDSHLPSLHTNLFLPQHALLLLSLPRNYQPHAGLPAMESPKWLHVFHIISSWLTAMRQYFTPIYLVIHLYLVIRCSLPNLKCPLFSVPFSNFLHPLVFAGLMNYFAQPGNTKHV